MEIWVEQQKLSEITTPIASLIPNRPLNPIFGDVLVEIRDRRLTLRATDGMLGMKLGMELDTSQNSSFLIPGHLLSKYIPLLKDQIHLKREGQYLVIEQDKHISRLTCTSDVLIEDFPLEPLEDWDTYILDWDILRRLTDTTLFAASRSTTANPVLTGWHLERGWAMGTDGEQLAFHRIPWGDIRVTIPREVISLVLRLKEGPINLKIGKNRILLEINNDIVWSSLYTDPYPSAALSLIEQLPRREPKVSFTTKVEDLNRILQIAEIFMLTTTYSYIAIKSIRLSVNDTIRFSFTSEIGQFNDAIPFTEILGQGEINFQPQLVRTAIGTISGEVIFNFWGPREPILIQDKDNKDWGYIVSPIVVRGEE